MGKQAMTLKRPVEKREHRPEGKSSRRGINISVDYAPEVKTALKVLAKESGVKLTDYMRAIGAWAIEKKLKARLTVTIEE